MFQDDSQIYVHQSIFINIVQHCNYDVAMPIERKIKNIHHFLMGAFYDATHPAALAYALLDEITI